MKKLMIFLGFCLMGLFLSNSVGAQSLAIQGTTGTLHVVHQVQPKETLFSLGRMYHIAPKDLAAYNNINVEKGIQIGQTVKVPLTAQNFVQSGSGGEGLVPVVYTIKPKEGLYRVSVNHNNVSQDWIKQINGLGAQALTIGQPVIVGFLKSNGSTPSTALATVPNQPPPVTKKEIVEVKPQPKVEEVVADKGEKGTSSNNNETVIKEAPKQDVVKITPVPAAPTIELEEQPAPPTALPKKEQKVYVPTNTGSYFQKQFEEQIAVKPISRAVQFDANIFKSASGWQDGKFYALVDGVEAGTIIKVTAVSTGKFVYAKVLGELPKIKQNSGLGMRISNAAVTELGIPEGKFTVSLVY